MTDTEGRRVVWPAKVRALALWDRPSSVTELEEVDADLVRRARDNGFATETSEANATPGWVRASDIAQTRLRWLWEGRLPAGKIAIFDGDPGVSKSVMSLDLAARISAGHRLPGGTSRRRPRPRGVVLVCAEDDWGDTIIPRLRVAGADLSRIASIQLRRDDDSGEVIPLTIPADLSRIASAVRGVDAALVVIDPIMGFLGAETNSHNDQSVRAALMPVAEMAAETGAAVLLIRHLNKAGDLKAAYRGGGSIAFSGLARAAFAVDRHPEDPDLLVVAQVKKNLTARGRSMTYRVESRLVDLGDGEEPMSVPGIVWGEEIDLDADTLLRKPDARRNAPERDRAADEIRALLAERDPWPAKEIQALLAQEYSASTWKAAKAAVGVLSRRVRSDDGKTDSWEWSLREAEEVSP